MLHKTLFGKKTYPTTYFRALNSFEELMKELRFLEIEGAIFVC